MRLITEAAMKRAWKWARRILIGVAAAMVLALIAWVTVVPGIVRRIATGELQRMGLRNVALQIRGLSLRHVQMANVAAGEDERLRVGAVGVGFTLGGLLKGRLSVIELTGLETEIRLHDGQLDLGPLADMGGGGGEGENPFAQIQLRSSAILLDLEGQRHRIPVEGTVNDTGGGRLALDLRLDAESCAASLTGTVDTNTNDLDLALKAQVREVAALLAALPPQWGKLPVSVNGSAEFDGSCSRQEGRLTLRGGLKPASVRLSGEMGGRRFSAGLRLSANAALADGRIEALYFRIHNGGVTVDGLPPIAGLGVIASLHSDVLTVPHASAWGRGWSLTLNMCGVKGILDALSGKASAITVHFPFWRCSLDPQQAVMGVPALRDWLQTASPKPVTVTGERATFTLTPSTKDSKTTWAWQLKAPDVAATWTAADVSVASPQAALQGVDAELWMAAEASADGLKAELLAGSKVSCAAASGTLDGAMLSVAKGEEAGLEVSLGKQKAELSAALKDGKLDWSVRVPDLAVALRAARAEGPMGLVADGITASAHLALEASPEKATLSLSPGSGLSVSAAKLSSLAAEATGIELHLGEKEARVTSSFKDGKLDWEVQAPDARLSIGRAKTGLPGGVAADGISVHAQLGVRANPREAVATVAGGSDLTVNSLKLPWLDIRKTAEGPLLGIELGEKGLEVKAPLGDEKPQWSLDIPELVVKQAEADLVLPNGLGKVEGCRGDFALSLKADPKEARMGAAGPCLASFKSAQATVGGEPLRLGPVGFATNVHAVTAGLDGMRLGFVEASLGVSMRGPVSVSLGQGVNLTVLSADADFDGGWSAEGGASLTASTGARVEAMVERKLGDAQLKADLPEVDLDVGVVVPSAASDNSPPLTLGFSLRTALDGKPATASIAGTDVTAGKAEVSGRVTFGGGAPVVEAKVALDKVAVQHKASGLALAGLSAEVPVSWKSDEPGTGKFAIEAVEAGGVKLANVSGTLGVADMRAEFSVAAEPLKGAKVSVEGSLDASRGTPKGMARLSLPLFTLEDEHELGRRVPALRGLLASGTFGVEGFARLAGGQVRPTLTLTVLDGVFKSKQWDMEADGVFATVRLSSLTPPLTPRKELQIVLVKRAKMGDLEVKNGALAFGLEPVEAAGAPTRWAAVIQRADWGWVGGRLFVEDVRIDPLAKEHHFTVHADDLKLGELLAVVSDKRLTGVGALTGQLPVTIAGWPRIRFGNGYLHAAADQHGWIHNEHLAPLEPTVAAIARSSVPTHLPEFLQEEGKRQVKESILSALRDLEYDELKLDFINEGERLLARVTTAGRARWPDRWGLRYAFSGIVLNFYDLDKEILDRILRARGSD